MPSVVIDDELAMSVPASRPHAVPTHPSPAVALPVKLAEPSPPRLERISHGEVALVTTGSAAWRPASPVRTASLRPASPVRTASLAPVRTALADPVRWIPLPLSRAVPGVQVLNAARSRGLAASARTVLFGRGWRAVGIGDATAVRRTSVVYYPAHRAALGRRLAAQFGVQAKLTDHHNVVLVLGRDSVGRIAGSRRA